MSIAEMFLAEFEVQAPITRKFLERLPEDKLKWKPHAKSMTAGQLAYHLATVPGGIAQFVKNNPAEAPKSFEFPQPASKSAKAPRPARGPAAPTGLQDFRVLIAPVSLCSCALRITTLLPLS